MKCFYCENDFTPKKWNSKFCSRLCCSKSSYQSKKGLAGKANDKKTCSFCLSEFPYSARKYCSSDCSAKASSKKRNGVRRSRIYSSYRVRYDESSIIERDGPECAHCNIETQSTDDSLSSFRNMDHILPLSKGGHDCEYNVQVLCKRCNNFKGSKLFDVDMRKAELLWPEDPNKYVEKMASKPKRNNRSGVTGVFFSKGADKWVSRIEVDSQRLEFKSETMSEAIKKRKLMVELAKKKVGIKDMKLKVGLACHK